MISFTDTATNRCIFMWMEITHNSEIHVRLLRHASPIPTTPPLLKVITEQRDLKSLNVDANILDGFQKDSEHHSKVPEEIKMEDEPHPRNMESSDVIEERKEKLRERQSNKKPESLDQSQRLILS